VLAHDRGRGIRVAPAHRGDELPVFLRGEHAHPRGGVPGLLKGHQQRPAERLDQHHHGRVVRGLRDPDVKVQRHPHRVVGGLVGGLRALADGLQVGQVLLGGPLADQRHDAGFQDHAYLGDVGGADHRKSEQVGQVLTDTPAGRGGDERAAARPDPDLDQPA